MKFAILPISESKQFNFSKNCSLHLGKMDYLHLCHCTYFLTNRFQKIASKSKPYFAALRGFLSVETPEPINARRWPVDKAPSHNSVCIESWCQAGVCLLRTIFQCFCFDFWRFKNCDPVRVRIWKNFEVCEFFVKLTFFGFSENEKWIWKLLRDFL